MIVISWLQEVFFDYSSDINVFNYAETKMLCSVPLQDSGKALAAAGTNADATEGATSTKKGFKIAYEQLENGRKRLIWWTDVKQVNGIYADWIDSV